MAAVACVLLGAVLVFSLKPVHNAAELPPLSRPTARTPASTVAPVVNRSLPMRLTIAKLNVDAAISYVGLTGNGEVSQPKRVADAGWYKYGALPGNAGSAVIVGHVNGLRGEPGVFKNLKKIQPGDAFTVTDDRNRVATFIVQTSRVYNHDDRPKEVFESNTDAYVNLITCTGPWDAKTRTYGDRLVVFAKKSD